MSKEQTDSIFSPYTEEISALYKNIKTSDEFEFDLNADKSAYLNYEKYVKLLSYVKYKNKEHNYDIRKNVTLDIIFSDNSNNEVDSYIITITELAAINKYIGMLSKRNNHVIYNTLLNLSLTDGKGIIQVRKKSKNLDNRLDIPDYNIRVRLAHESPIPSNEIKNIPNIPYMQAQFITYRFKQRVSLIIEKDSEHNMQIDLTDTKISNTLEWVAKSKSNYELEVELFASSKLKTDYVPKLIQEVTNLLKIIQQNNYILAISKKNEIIDEYVKLSGSVSKYNLEARQAQSIEIQHVTETVMNKYAVTDKADGERHFLMIHDKHVYFISQTLNVIDSGIKLKTNDYDGTLLDGEYVFIQKHNRYLFLAFDCLFHKGIDVRKTVMFMERLEKAIDVITNCFVLKGHDGFDYKTLPIDNEKFKASLENIMKFYSTELNLYMKNLQHDIPIKTELPLIRVKFFIPAHGLKDNEIFKYSMIMWNKYLNDGDMYAYKLDGLVYHPLTQMYISKQEDSKYLEYKWKPPEKNSIDFYITFEKERKTGKILTIYDNAINEETKNRSYRICYLHVGKKLPTGEIPVLFQEQQELYKAYIFLQDGEARDADGNIIRDETVVEFYYENNLDIDERFRWIPLRTRHDKTESVNRFKRKYGNNNETANKIWHSIVNPVLLEDLQSLADDGEFENHLKDMRKKLGKESLDVLKREAYYQKRDRIAVGMRQFHNWIKSVLIYTYMNPMYQDKKHFSILDVACGQGGDIFKYYYVSAASVVGIDIDNEALWNINGAVSRYNDLRKKKPAVPRMSFVCADFTAPLDASHQKNIIKNISNQNISMIEKIFPEKNMQQFDRIDVQFAFHYFLRDEITWTNVCNNINKCLKPTGFMVITVFDSDKIIEAFKGTSKITLSYTEDGENKVLVDIIKKCYNLKNITTGCGVGVYNSMYSFEGDYRTEYLVSKNFLIDEMRTRCNMELIDSDTFENLYEIHKENLMNADNVEENPETRKFLKNTSAFYDDTVEMNKVGYQLMRLYRYYVFKKIDGEVLSK